MSRATILIVEDEAIVAADLASKLKQLGYGIAGSTARGEEALALARQRRPDLVLMDIRLAGAMDGVEAAGRIREECGLPVIYLTAHSDRATLQRAKLTEPFGYVLKPFDERELETHIEMALYGHEAERKLRQQRQWLEVTLRSIGDAVVATDTQGRVTFFNPVAASLTGWKPEEVLGRPLQSVFKVINERTRAPAEDIVARVIHEKRIVVMANHTNLVDPQGKEVPIEDSAAPIRDLAGNVEGVVLVFRDVTRRRRSEAARARLAAIVESSEDAIISQSLDGLVTSWNPAAERLFGYRAEEILGQPLDLIIPPGHQAEEGAVLERLRAGVRIEHYETVRVDKSGRRIDVSLTISPVRDEAGDVTGVSKIARDITQRKKTEQALREAQEQLRQHAANLEQTVHERTAKLEELVGELEHFSYTITHDMRAPLRAMKGFGQVVTELCAKCPRQEQRGFLRRIMTSADRMDSLIRDALNYSQVARQELPLKPVDAGALLRGMLDSYPELQPTKAHIRLEGDLPPVLANEAGLTQCFSNLLDNAVKFRKPGLTPEVRVWAEQRDGWARIWVEDDGIGISRSMLPRVFELFSRGHRAYEGTGIGLALVRKVMDRMGGKAGVESEEGKGSRFWLELKLAGLTAAPKRGAAEWGAD